MAMHIVTSRCFLTCEKVTYIKLEEFPKDLDTCSTPKTKKKVGRPKKSKAETKIELEYRILIGYYPLGTTAINNNYNGGSESNLDIIIADKQKANALYAEIVREVQEQHPNEGYLDQLVNKILATEEFLVELTEEPVLE